MRWTAPPERREIGLVLLCFLTYFISYNIEVTLQVLGIDAAATKGAVLSRLGVGSNIIGEDGRKPAGWRDNVELDIYGSWEWMKGHVAGDGTERSQLSRGSVRHGAQWILREDIEDVGGLQKPFGDSTTDDSLQHWGDDIPVTRMVNHVPGYTILDNVYIFNGSVYLIANKTALPPMTDIVQSTGLGFKEWKTLSLEEGRQVVGKYGSAIRGISWLHADTTPDNSTLFALWKTHSSLDTTIGTSGTTTLPLPRRLVFPHSPFFLDGNPEPDEYTTREYTKRRERIDTGFHPYTLKAAFPSLTLMYQQDWNDYHAMEVPFVFERLVIADRSVAAKSVKEGEPVYAPAMQLNASTHWWEPVRKNLAQFVEEYDVPAKAKKAITYLHTQGGKGAKLSEQDHEELVNALGRMGAKIGYEVHVVSADPNQTDWITRMTSLAKSTIVLGVHGNHLLDGLFMQPSAQSTLVELFPENEFVRDRELVARSAGLQYSAISKTSIFSTDLPPVQPPNDNDLVSIDIDTIIENIKEALAQSHS